MAPAVILIGCLLATMSGLTTASIAVGGMIIIPTLNTTTVPPPAAFNVTAANPSLNSTARSQVNSTTNPSLNSTARSQVNSTTNPSLNSTARSQVNSTTRPPFNSTTRSQVNSTTIPPFNSNTIPPSNQSTGSCGNPGLCCSGVNSNCRRLNCFCDVACLRLQDCCPDFKPTCLTVNNSSNSTKPNNTLPLTGSCSEPTLCCSGTDYNCFRGCFCDEACKLLNDCCPDINSTCIFNTTTAPPQFNITTTTPFTTTTAPHKDVLTLLTNLEVEVLAGEWSTEEERQAALREVGAMLENSLRAYNTDIYSFEVTRIEPVSPCD